LYDIVDKQSWYSNCHVENWFASVKASHLKQSSIGARLSVTKFIQKEREIILQKINRFKLSESRDAPSTKKTKDKTTMHDCKEKWGMGRKKRAKYVKPQAKSVNKLFKAMNPSVPVSSSEEDSYKSDSSGKTECYDYDSKYDSNDFLPDIESPKKNVPVYRSKRNVPVNISNKNVPVNSSKRNVPANSSKKNVPINSSKKNEPVHTSKGNARRSLSKLSTFHPKPQDEGNKLEFMTRTGYHITSQDKLSLKGSEWLQLNVVTAYIECIDTAEYVSWTDGAWSLIEKGKCIGAAEDAIKKTDWTKVRKVIIGRGEPGHFVLIIEW